MRSLALALAALLALGACGTPAPPATPPTSFAEPPPIAAEGYVDSFSQAEVPMTPAQLRAFLQERPFISFFEAEGSISPPVEVTVLSGVWPEPGAVRRLRQADGHYIVERVLENRPDLFRYQVWGFTGAASRGVAYIIGEQAFTPSGAGGATFAWTYRIMPTSALTAIFVRRQREREVQPFMDGAVRRMAEAASARAGAQRLSHAPP